MHVPQRPIRIVTAASLYDGHDAAINIMRRILQSQGAEVIHLGHNRSVGEIVDAAISEDAHAIAVSSYQGGHIEFFQYLVDLLNERGASHIKVFGGGGGTIVPEEIAHLHNYGVARIFSPADGAELGLPAMVNTIIKACDEDMEIPDDLLIRLRTHDVSALARTITLLEDGRLDGETKTAISGQKPVVLGITGTGGSGKSSLTDEFIRRLRTDQQDKVRVAVIAIDPTRRKGKGALLGDRIRMNAIDGGEVAYFRSIATRDSVTEVPNFITDVIGACAVAGYDLVIIETPGIGQGDSAIADIADHSLYVMTAEFGAPSQLEKIDMLDYADTVAVNKSERRGTDDAVRDVARQLVRNREAFNVAYQDMPVFATSAATFNDPGLTRLYLHVRDALGESGLALGPGLLDEPVEEAVRRPVVVADPGYLAGIAKSVRGYHKETEKQATLAVDHAALSRAQELGIDTGSAIAELESAMDPNLLAQVEQWPDLVARYSQPEYSVTVRDTTTTVALTRETLSGSQIPRVALPRFGRGAELVRFLRSENVPGRFPYTAGVFEFKRDNEDPTRMFAGEGDASRTNKRFKLLSEGQRATRLSTAFDSVTLYGQDPAERPDVWGKVGTSGVSISTIEDMRQLYDGFDLCSPSTSVSMTINGPAPTILAFFLNNAIDREIEAFTLSEGREPSLEEAKEIRAKTLRTVRGTVQADILKEDQGQNTCLFSTDFSLRMMADIAEWFAHNDVRNFYSVSISGYHIAEAGANPISQLAFTLANGFTYVEAYLARGMHIDQFAPNLSFFFSVGMDPEYTVLGRVARRIWAIAMRDRYGANERSQKLKYHTQTSGRSLHAQEIDFNDIRTTLQALSAIYDNANSLHTNAFDEAITTPSEESVRRALAIQLIINREWGLAQNENPLQGSFIIEELTDLVEEAVLAEFDRIHERGGVLGAMETGYQRGKIQDESMLYEHRKHDGSLPIIGVNTFLPPGGATIGNPPQLIRGTEEERQQQLARLEAFKAAHREEAEQARQALREAAHRGENLFAVLMDAARVCTLGQLTEIFFEIGGQYRRNV